VGVSAGAACALQMALRHPDRVSALVLVAPIAWKPASIADSAPHVPDGKDEWLLRLLGSDFLYWAGLQAARDQVLRHVLATSPELIHAASAQEQARVNAMAERVLPVSQRARLLLDDVTVTFAQAIPEPATSVLLLAGLGGCALAASLRRKTALDARVIRSGSHRALAKRGRSIN
jgi:pimeloyl-ACP methyl ester carboxylesterase